MENTKFKCAECGGSELQVRAWVNMNNNEYISECDDGEFWCENCETFVDFQEEIKNLYTVQLERSPIATVKIKASSEDEAIDIAFDMYRDDKINFCSSITYEVIETKDINY